MPNTPAPQPLPAGTLVRIKGSKVVRAISSGPFDGERETYLLTANVATRKGGGQFTIRAKLELVQAVPE